MGIRDSDSIVTVAEEVGRYIFGDYTLGDISFPSGQGFGVSSVPLNTHTVKLVTTS